MNHMQAIQQAIDRLSPAERYSIATWILESRHAGDRVAEPAAAYNTSADIRLLSVEDYLDFESGLHRCGVKPRRLPFGISARKRLLAVSHTEEEEDMIPVIGARLAG